jgi:hypothetical protein
VPRELPRSAAFGSAHSVVVGEIHLISGNAVAFVNPRAQIDQLAAFAAKRLPSLQW